MEYDRVTNFPINFEQNGVLFGSKSKGKLISLSYLIQFENLLKIINLYSECINIIKIASFLYIKLLIQT